MTKEKITEHILPRAQNIPRLQSLVALEKILDQPSALRRLAALLPAGVAQTVSEDLGLSRHEQEILLALNIPRPELLNLSDQLLRRFLRRWGPEQLKDIVLLEAAGKNISAEILRPILEKIRHWVILPFPLHGQDVLDLGIPPGPQVGTLLKTIEIWWEEKDYTPDREMCLAELERVVKRK